MGGISWCCCGNFTCDDLAFIHTSTRQYVRNIAYLPVGTGVLEVRLELNKPVGQYLDWRRGRRSLCCQERAAKSHARREHELLGAGIGIHALSGHIVPHQGIRALERGVAHHVAHHRRGLSANCWAAGAAVVPDLAAALRAHRAGRCAIRAAWRVGRKAVRAHGTATAALFWGSGGAARAFGTERRKQLEEIVNIDDSVAVHVGSIGAVATEAAERDPGRKRCPVGQR